MPARPPSLTALRDALAAQGALVVAALAAADPAAPTGCAGWTVADLDRHLGAVAGSLASVLASPVDGPASEGVQGWADALPALAERLDREARTDGPGLAAELPRALTALEQAAPDVVVQQWTGRHTAADAALFRLVELVVHGRDLPAPVTPDRSALKPVVKALTALLAARAPGRHVELRVPPLAAVQCVEGPRHTRGTPPNVVEVEPVAFVELAAGRLGWSAAARDGRVRTWGDRADLSAWLPLLG